MYWDSEWCAVGPSGTDDVTSHLLRPDVNVGSPEMSSGFEDVTTLDVSNYVLTTDGACSRKV